MFNYFWFFFFMISVVGFSQKNTIIKTADGKSILLKADHTWEYINFEEVKTETKSQLLEIKTDACNLGANYQEPALNGKIQNQLKRGKSSIPYIKKRVAKDLNCNPEEVILLFISEQKERGLYHFCANGKKVAYKRIGNAVMKSKKKIL